MSEKGKRSVGGPSEGFFTGLEIFGVTLTYPGILALSGLIWDWRYVIVAAPGSALGPIWRPFVTSLIIWGAIVALLVVRGFRRERGDC